MSEQVKCEECLAPFTGSWNKQCKGNCPSYQKSKEGNEMKPKYICHDCGKTFDEPKYERECVGEFWGAPAYESYDACPFCGSDYIEERGDRDEHKRSETEGTEEV